MNTKLEGGIRALVVRPLKNIFFAASLIKRSQIEQSNNFLPLNLLKTFEFQKSIFMFDDLENKGTNLKM